MRSELRKALADALDMTHGTPWVNLMKAVGIDPNDHNLFSTMTLYQASERVADLVLASPFPRHMGQRYMGDSGKGDRKGYGVEIRFTTPEDALRFMEQMQTLP